MGKVIAIGGGYNGGDFDKQLEEKIRGFIPYSLFRMLRLILKTITSNLRICMNHKGVR